MTNKSRQRMANVIKMLDCDINDRDRKNQNTIVSRLQAKLLKKGIQPNKTRRTDKKKLAFKNKVDAFINSRETKD